MKLTADGCIDAVGRVEGLEVVGIDVGGEVQSVHSNILREFVFNPLMPTLKPSADIDTIKPDLSSAASPSISLPRWTQR